MANHLPQYHAHIYQKCNINLKLTHHLTASFMSYIQLNNIQKLIHPEVIASKGFNRNWSHQLRYGKYTYN